MDLPAETGIHFGGIQLILRVEDGFILSLTGTFPDVPPVALLDLVALAGGLRGNATKLMTKSPWAAANLRSLRVVVRRVQVV